MNNKYPIFVISYKRPKNHITARTLAEFGVNHYLVLHENQQEEYKKHFTPEMGKYTTILTFDQAYKLKYETCDNIPHRVKNAGSGAERNFAWDYSKNILKAKAHWLMDDNQYFYYVVGKNNKNIYVRKSATKENFMPLFQKGEKFFDRYENLLMIELKQQDFLVGVQKLSYSLNTRCFSCNLIYNDMPIRWRGRYNEDVILSYDIMTAGYCIASYHGGILKKKVDTRTARGGNHATSKTDKDCLYSDADDYRNSSIDKTNLVLKVYPKYFEKIIKYGRVHHKYLKADELKKNLRLKPAQLAGIKKINLINFEKIYHYPIPQ